MLKTLTDNVQNIKGKGSQLTIFKAFLIILTHYDINNRWKNAKIIFHDNEISLKLKVY